MACDPKPSIVALQNEACAIAIPGRNPLALDISADLVGDALFKLNRLQDAGTLPLQKKGTGAMDG